jgi:hypothetical protein
VTLWEILFLVVLLKIPVAYVASVVWWAIKAEPEAGVEGGTEGISWGPWRRRPPKPGRPERGTPRGAPSRSRSRAARGRERASRAG